MAEASLAELARKAAAFRDARDWKQFHNAKDVALSLNLEAAELLEIFQWKDATAATVSKDRIAEELSDILYWVLLMARDLDIDLPTAFERKLKANEAKYPVARAKGSAKKYTEL
jgi:NTP pyrophosphatase (non-canonical NTP hydrolase)